MSRLFRLLACAAVATQAWAATSLTYGPSSFAAPGPFPTSLYKSYYNDPTATSAQPQPIISDPVLHKVYPLELTDPKDIPQDDPQDRHPLPRRASGPVILQDSIAQVQGLFINSAFANNSCALCTATLLVAKLLALAAPEQGPAFTVFLCQQLKLSTRCNTTFGATTLGPVVTQVLANADVAGYDGRALPPTPALNLTGWFAKPKPSPLPPPKKPSGERLKVLHLSDFHIDPRYATGSEANCTSGLCCRANNPNADSLNKTLLPAPRYGWFGCLLIPANRDADSDTPFSLAAAVLEAIPVLTGTEKTGFAWTLYTGDLVSHDAENQLSRKTVVYDLFKRMLGSGPVYAALGNHDSYNQAQDAHHSLGGELAKQFSWNYEHVAKLWQQEQWIPQSVVAQARAHYAAYSVQRTDGLRVITLNTDLWYSANLFNYINLTQPDNSGMLRFLTDELQDAEDKEDRGMCFLKHRPHVSVKNFCHQFGFLVMSRVVGMVPIHLKRPRICFTRCKGRRPFSFVMSFIFIISVDRFSPHVIANIFWGHTHQDQFSIFYANNATNISAETALATSWIGPSVTPLTNLNSGFRVYEVDSATFDILDAHTWRSDVNSFPALDGQTSFGPTYVYEYNTRATYGTDISGWGSNDPLNATWWHLVTERETAFTLPTRASLLTEFIFRDGSEP
ncbi:Metallo-dependent phosphatase-like protein [Lactarius psammicola]|nr:Metallo-dependent phosphatase-like protein [Lactarius psammicola]